MSSDLGRLSTSMKTKTKQKLQKQRKRQRDRLIWQEKSTAKHKQRMLREPQTVAVYPALITA